MSRFSRIVAASPGGAEGASARYRLGPVASAGRWAVEILPAANVPSPEQIDALLAAADSASILVLQRILPSSGQMQALRRTYARIVFDFDDALQAVPPAVGRHPVRNLPKAVARTVLRGSPTASARARPLARVLREVDLVVAGNAVLGDFARRHADRVAEIPTTVEPIERPAGAHSDRVVVWLGLPDNLQYLNIVVPALRGLDARLRIVSSRAWTHPGIESEFVEWSPAAARSALLSSRVGIAPLTDDAWTRGKCALRAIQYAGHALPVVATPVGITDRVVLHRKTGYLAGSTAEWSAFLRELLDDPGLAAEMGTAGLEHIRAQYSDDVAVAAWHEALDSLAEGPL